MSKDMFKFYDIPEEYSRFGRFGKMVWSILKDREIMLEGLITSYPFSSVLAMLNRKYSNIISHIQSDPFATNLENVRTSGISLYIKKKTFNDSVLEQIKKDVDVYDYFIAFIKKFNINEIGIFIEPKYPFIIDEKYLKNKRFFHITNKKYLEKIKKIGLTPKNSQTNFEHPGNRIYLMASVNTTLIDNFKQTLSKSKNWNINDIITLEITPDKLEFYIDPNFDNNQIESDIAVFTLNNIPPNLIEIL